jgi:thioredoxin reductase (NADPH)
LAGGTVPLRRVVPDQICLPCDHRCPRPYVQSQLFLQEAVAKREDMTTVTNHAVQEFAVADGRLAAVKVLDKETGQVKEWHPDGAFIFIGMVPNSEFLPPEIERDRRGFVITDQMMQTSVRGFFAAGDVRAGATDQAASAAGEGAAAALMMRDYLRTVA